METKTIRVSNTKDKAGKYGPSLQIGVKDGEEWTNYYVNKPELFSYFEKGASVTIEYEVKNGYNVVRGVAPNTPQASGGRNDATGKSIELQVLCKVYGEMATELPTAAEFGAWVLAAHKEVFDPAAKAADALKEAFDAEEEDVEF